MRIEMPYGGDRVAADIDWGRSLGTLDVADAPALHDPAAAVEEALVNPIGLKGSLFDAVRPGESVALIVSDSFRQTRADQFLPILVDRLNAAGIRDEAMHVCFSTGTHRAPTPAEAERILGTELYRRFAPRAFAHDAHDSANLQFLGTTRRGTPVWVNKRVLACDRIVATGTVVLHYFGGFGGGRKSVVPGIAGVETISRNHSMNLDPHSDRLNPDVRIGALDGNPVAEDMLEAARFVPVDFILNTVLNRRGEIAAVFAGEMDAAHRVACQRAYDLYATPIRERADLVIASAGTAKNFVQSHKALFNAFQALKPGGRIVFVARCEEGPGGEQFVKWLRRRDRDDIIAGLRERAEINGQTALSTFEKAPSALFVTGMTAQDVALLRGRKADSLVEALNLARAELAASGIENPTVWRMPSAAYTVPVGAALSIQGA
jgi:nickel-dependent lactate racemase